MRTNGPTTSTSRTASPAAPESAPSHEAGHLVGLGRDLAGRPRPVARTTSPGALAAHTGALAGALHTSGTPRRCLLAGPVVAADPVRRGDAPVVAARRREQERWWWRVLRLPRVHLQLRQRARLDCPVHGRHVVALGRVARRVLVPRRRAVGTHPSAVPR